MLRNVKVYDRTGKLLATYPIDYNFMGDEPNDSDFVAEAMRCAREDKVASSDEELRHLRFEVVA